MHRIFGLTRKVAFAAFLKNWRRDCNSSFRFFSLIALFVPYRYLGVGLVCLKKKRRNLYLLPSYHWRLLALPYLCRTATQKPTPVYAIKASGHISPEISCRKQDNYISTGIYRCSILVTSMNFARIPNGQESARINAFLCIFTTSRSA